MTERRRIAYLCDLTPHDTHSYSGGNARIHEALQNHVGDVTVLDPGWGAAEPLRRAIQHLPENIDIRLRWRVRLMMSQLIAPSVTRQLVRGRFDVLFGAYAFHALAGVRRPNGMLGLYTSDATPTTYKRSEIGSSFGSFLKVSRLVDPMILRAERRVFTDMDLLLWPTEWLKSGADALYGLEEARSLVVPWGANVADPRPSDLQPSLSRGAPVRFLLIGRDWVAKGGPLVFDTMMALRAKGIDSTLDVIGVEPPAQHRDDLVRVHGVLDKSRPEDLARFEAVLRGAHFLFQPSFESYGFAFCEASAYGLPSLCLRVGGVPVREGVNGHALPANSGPEAFAARVMAYLDTPEAYRELRFSARQEYEERLNWDAWGRRVDSLISARNR